MLTSYNNVYSTGCSELPKWLPEDKTDASESGLFFWLAIAMGIWFLINITLNFLIEL